MLWDCFAASGTSALHKVDRIMEEEDYLQILELLFRSTVDTWTIVIVSK